MSNARAVPQSPGGAALTEMILLVFRLNGRLLESAERMASAGGLTAARWQVIAGVLDEPRPVAEIARRMGLTRQSVQRIANRLAEEGFATWEPNPRHRRAKLLAPTARTRAALGEISALQHPWSSEVGDTVGEARIREATGVIEDVLEAVQSAAAARRAAA